MNQCSRMLVAEILLKKSNQALVLIMPIRIPGFCLWQSLKKFKRATFYGRFLLASDAIDFVSPVVFSQKS